MSVFRLCERAIGLIRGKRLELSGSEAAMLEALNYEGLIAVHAQDEAVTCARHFAYVRDKLLQLYPWVFARKTAALAQLSAALPGWRFAYALPADCLKLLALVEACKENSQLHQYHRHHRHKGLILTHWEQIGRTVCCNHRQVHARYTAQVTDTNQWDAAFTDVFCSSLAAEGIASVTGEVNAIQLMEQRAQLGIQEAYRIGAIVEPGGLPAQQAEWMDYSGVPSRFDDHGGYWGY